MGKTGAAVARSFGQMTSNSPFCHWPTEPGVLMFSLPWENWLRLAIWLAIGLAIYFSYGHKHSVLAKMMRGK